jgi:hypothetical protein|tara:strand:- start:13374 stop:13895 length:522 start_codon:yes stop_codon:yes gene_type:complete
MSRKRRGAKIVPDKNEELTEETQSEALETQDSDSDGALGDDNERAAPSKTYSDLQDLVYLGRISEDVEFSGFTFRVRTLSTGQQRQLVERIMLLTEAERFARVRDYTMAQAVETVNNVPLEKLCTDDTIDNEYEKRLSVISGWQSVLVDTLYKEYEKLFEKSSNSFLESDLKK